MKILYIDISMQGHREKYLKKLISLNNIDNFEAFVLVPQKLELDGIIQYEMKSNFYKKRTIINYIKFIDEIKKIADENEIDIIHFLCGDALYRFFGTKLNKLKQKVVITYHHMILQGIKKYSIKRIFRKSTIGIVHTEKLYKDLQNNCIRNSKLIDYPMLDCISNKNINEAKAYYNLPINIPVLGVIGGTSKYKGLDFLIQALNCIDKRCCLFVAGREIDFNEEYIRTSLKNTNITLVTCIRNLSDEEFADAIQASDVIMLPYRLEFDGASGILIESLFHNKHVIGSNHGSMGDLIRTYDLGRTFNTNNIEELVKEIQSDIEKPYVLTKKSDKYREIMDSQRFLNLNKDIYEVCLK